MHRKGKGKLIRKLVTNLIPLTDCMQSKHDILQQRDQIWSDILLEIICHNTPR